MKMYCDSCNKKIWKRLKRDTYECMNCGYIQEERYVKSKRSNRELAKKEIPE